MLGAAALIAGPALAMLQAVIFSGVLGSLACLGVWLYSRFRTLSIRVVLDRATASEDVAGSA